VGAAPGGEPRALNRVPLRASRQAGTRPGDADRYGRLLAYVWINDTMVNLKWSCGYARA
jgi:endonuclease YncB( thermonuclease family)